MAKIFFDGKTKAEWVAANPVLADGEMVYETDTHRIKFGDGITAYSSLPYAMPYKVFTAIIQLGSSDEGLEPQILNVLEDTIGITGIAPYEQSGVVANMILADNKFTEGKTVINVASHYASGSSLYVEPAYLNENGVLLHVGVLVAEGGSVEKIPTLVSGNLVTVEIKVYP